jgi:hypothetical protein
MVRRWVSGSVAAAAVQENLDNAWATWDAENGG